MRDDQHAPSCHPGSTSVATQLLQPDPRRHTPKTSRRECWRGQKMHKSDTSETMKAIRFSRYGDPDVLELVAVPLPHPGAGQIRLRARAAAVNAADLKQESGLFQDRAPATFPASVGLDSSGTVDAIGEGVVGVALGDTVFGFAVDGAFAEQTILSHWMHKPDGMTFDQAAALPVSSETAYRLLVELEPRPGETLLITGAAGTVGLMLSQLALARQIRVVGTARQDDHSELRRLGVQPVDYGPGWVERLTQQQTSPIRYGVDTSGHGTVPDLVAFAGTPDRVITITDSNAHRHGVRFSTGPGTEPEVAWAEAAGAFQRGELKVSIRSVWPLSASMDAQISFRDGTGIGKTIVSIP
ncbi:NADP-dependent oxidoreductase [Glaciihabitans sp. UYNi722]|uniref:NADP-dependent oxidoreductase n=1 Tax=Glaciihabitans sp. UYNi722 TaxID=3156344 RepID=UPI003398A9CB